MFSHKSPGSEKQIIYYAQQNPPLMQWRLNSCPHMQWHGLPWWLSSKESAFNAGDMGLIPGSGRVPGEWNGNPLHYSCLGILMDRGVWWATVPGVAKELDTIYQLKNNSSGMYHRRETPDLGNLKETSRGYWHMFLYNHLEGEITHYSGQPPLGAKENISSLLHEI